GVSDLPGVEPAAPLEVVLDQVWLLADPGPEVLHRGQGLGSAAERDAEVLARGLEQRTHVKGDERLHWLSVRRTTGVGGTPGALLRRSRRAPDERAEQPC